MLHNGWAEILELLKMHSERQAQAWELRHVNRLSLREIGLALGVGDPRVRELLDAADREIERNGRDPAEIAESMAAAEF